MSRLFISLFAMILLAIVAFMLGIDGITGFMFKGVIEDMREYQLGGIVRQLDKQIETLDEEQRQTRLQQLQDIFIYQIDLQHIDQMDVSDSEKQRLRDGEFISSRVDGAEYNYHQSSIKDLSWVLQLEPTLTGRDRAFVTGPLILMEQELALIPPDQWQQKVTDIDRQFGVPINMLLLAGTTIKQQLNESQQKKLQAGESILLYREGELEYIYYPIQDSQQIIKIGQIEYPLILLNFSYVIIAIMAGMVALVIWLWLRPVWQDLRKLKMASEAIGQGKLDTRIEVSRYSVVKTILQAFNVMASHIQQLIISHKTLTNAVSHELRTPVSRLRFSMEMLEKTENEADKNRYLQAMNADVDELDEMLAELLSYARLDRQSIQLDKQVIVLGDWLEQQTAAWKQDCKVLELAVTQANLPAQAVACMDQKLMQRLIHNLLQNACRYASKNIHLHMEYKDKHYSISVDDDGCGIPEQYHASIFDPFTRVDNSRNRESGGYGLGLAIAKQIANAHQGDISIQPSVLGGIRFVVKWK